MNAFVPPPPGSPSHVSRGAAGAVAGGVAGAAFALAFVATLGSFIPFGTLTALLAVGGAIGGGLGWRRGGSAVAAALVSGVLWAREPSQWETALLLGAVAASAAFVGFAAAAVAAARR